MAALSSYRYRRSFGAVGLGGVAKRDSEARMSQAERSEPKGSLDMRLRAG